MQSKYNLESDSDEEDGDTKTKVSMPRQHAIHLQELEKLKQQTQELLAPEWKLMRNKALLTKMLELEEPVITAKMVDFLLQDGVTESLMAFITQVGINVPRPGPTDDASQSHSMKLSYKAVLLLTANEPTEALMTYLSKRAFIISKCIFDIFRDDSAGSFYHVYRIFGCLLRCFPGDVYDAFVSEGKFAERMTSMLRYVGHVPVGELLVMLIALTPISSMSQLYVMCAKSRWKCLEQMMALNLILKLTDIVVKPEEYCFIDENNSGDQHSCMAAQVLTDLVEKMSLEDTGEMILHPFGTSAPLINCLVDAAFNSSLSDGRRCSATRLLCFLLRRAAEPEIMCIISPVAGANPTPTSIPNRLYPFRERLINLIEVRMKDILSSLSSFSSSVSKNNSAVQYSSYKVKEPFTVLRSFLIELVALMVESDETISNYITMDMWRLFFTWTITYAHNNVYHALFYRLIFAVLRQNQEEAQRNLFIKAKFANFLIENFSPFPAKPSDQPPKNAPEDVATKSAVRGVLLNCANAVRLQASCQPPSSFLRMFLNSHQKWGEFQPALTEATETQQSFGMGIPVVDHTNNHDLASLMMMAAEYNPDDHGMEHGSRFAKSLGFFDEIAWPPESPSETKKKMKKRAKKKDKGKKATDASGGSDGAAAGEDSENCAQEEEGEDEDEDGEEGEEEYDDEDEEDDEEAEQTVT